MFLTSSSMQRGRSESSDLPPPVQARSDRLRTVMTAGLGGRARLSHGSGEHGAGQDMDKSENLKVGVVIPCYKVRNHVLGVLSAIGPEVSRIYVVDDCCPDGSGAFVEKNSQDKRVSVIRHSSNQGVGGAVMTGYRAAISDRMDIIV